MAGIQKNKGRRLGFGILLLLFVDLLWVASSEVTKYLFDSSDFQRPFFTTYVKNCMFVLYLIGFVVHKPWRTHCSRSHNWFLGNYAYQLSLQYSTPAIVNVLSTTSTVFTLLLAAVLPASNADRFSVSKACLVFLNFAGVAVICLFDESENRLNGSPLIAGFTEWSPATLGAIWAVTGSAAYAAYLVLLKRATGDEPLNIGMFFGFVGLFNLVLMWPGFYILHSTGVESIHPGPNRTQAFLIFFNGLLGTVVSEYLWLWGCFLTSSLIATLSLSLIVPMTVIADALLWKKQYPWQFSVGSGLILAAFLCNALLLHKDNVDPIMCVMCRTGQRVWSTLRRCRPSYRFSCPAPSSSCNALDAEQRESLIT